MPPDIHFLIDTKHRFIKFQMQVFAEIRSALSATATPSALPKRIAESEDVAKDVAEILEDCRIESSRCPAAAAKASMPKAVIQRSLLAIRENCISLGDFFERLFRRRIVRVAVGMVRHRQLAISALDFHLGGSTSNTKDFVIISFCVGGQKLSPLSFQNIALTIRIRVSL